MAELLENIHRQESTRRYTPFLALTHYSLKTHAPVAAARSKQSQRLWHRLILASTEGAVRWVLACIRDSKASIAPDGCRSPKAQLLASTVCEHEANFDARKTNARIVPQQDESAKHERSRCA